MAMEVATGVLSVDTGVVTTQYSVTGLSFQPKAIILWWSGRADTSDASGERDIQPGLGVAVSATSRWAVTAHVDHGPTTTVTGRYQTNAACVAVLDIAGAVVGLADFVSFNSDGFTLVVDDAFPALVRVSWTALGGSDLTHAETGTFNLLTGTGDGDYTGLTSFEPDFALFGSINTDIAIPAGTTTARLTIGAATPSAQALLSFYSANGVGTSATAAYCRAGEIWGNISSVTALDGRASFTSFLSDGFRLNKLEGAGVPDMFFLALKGGQYKIGDFVTPTDTTAFTEATGLTQAAKGAMFFSANNTQNTQDAAQEGMEWSVGAAVSGTSRNAQYVKDKSASANSDCFSAIEHDAIYINASSAATMVIEGTGDLNSFDANGDMTLQMDDADPSASFVWYIAFGNAPGQTIAVAQVTETDLAQAIARLKTKAISQISETDLAQTITRLKVATIGQTSETDAAQTIAALKSWGVAQVSETDIAHAVLWAPKHRLVAQVSEVSLAQSLTAKKAKEVAQALEADAAQAVSWAPKHRLVTLASEIDAAQAIIAGKIREIGQVAETDLAQAIARLKAKLLEQAGETDLAQIVSVGGQLIIAVNQVLETDLAQAVSWAPKYRFVNQVSEISLAQSLTARKAREIAQALEIDAAEVVAASKLTAIAQAVESDIAQGLSPRKLLALAEAFETDLAGAVMWSPKIRLIGIASETDLAFAIVVIQAVLLKIEVLLQGELVTGVAMTAKQEDEITLSGELVPGVSIEGKFPLG